MNGTSSQDEFAKWAKLRRKHDKTLEEYEAMSMCCLPAAVDMTVILSANGFMSRQAAHGAENLFRLEYQNRPMDQHQRLQILPPVLLLQDAGLSAPAGLVSLLRSVGSVLPARTIGVG